MAATVFVDILSASCLSMAPATSPLTPLNDLGGVGLGAWARWRWWSSPCWIWGSWRHLLTRKTAPLMKKRDRARPARYVWSQGGGKRVAFVCCADAHHFLQLGNRAKRHQPWLSLHSSKVIRDPDGAACYPEENQEDASLRGRYCTSPLRAHSNSHSNTDREQNCWGCLSLSIVPRGFPPLTHCCQTSAVRWRRGRTTGCNGGTRAVTARRATARTALVMWAMTAGGPPPIVTWMVSSLLLKSLKTIYLFCKIITVLTWKILKIHLNYLTK